MSLRSRGQAALLRRKKKADGLAVTVTREASPKLTATLTGWEGRTRFASNRLDGPRVEHGELDLLFAVADYDAAGFGEPKEHDRFRVAGDAATYELLPPDTGEPAWRYSNPERTILRLHLKQVKT